MVRFKEVNVLILGTAEAADPVKLCGKLEKNVGEKNSDEVTLPNFRPRNSP